MSSIDHLLYVKSDTVSIPDAISASHQGFIPVVLHLIQNTNSDVEGQIEDECIRSQHRALLSENFMICFIFQIA